MTTEQLYARMKKSQAIYMAHTAQFMKHVSTEAETIASAGINARPRIAAIQDVICLAYALEPGVMTTHARPQHYAQPRQTAMALCRELTKYSLEEIGRCFGGRDHGTIIHACECVRSRVETETSFRAEFELLKDACRNRIDNSETPLFATHLEKVLALKTKRSA